jgi:hypothetical protein
VSGPERITPTKLADYLDVLTKAVFQSGISWRVVEAKWPGTREALYEFDPERLADLTPDDVDRLAQDQRLVRNRRKIEATVDRPGQALQVSRRDRRVLLPVGGRRVGPAARGVDGDAPGQAPTRVGVDRPRAAFES